MRRLKNNTCWNEDCEVQKRGVGMGRYFDLMIRRACTEEVGFVRREHRAPLEVTG